MSDDQQTRNMKAAIQQLADITQTLLDTLAVNGIIGAPACDQLNDKIADAKELAL